MKLNLHSWRRLLDRPQRERHVTGQSPGGDRFCLAPLSVVRRGIVTLINYPSLVDGLVTTITARAFKGQIVYAAAKRLLSANLDLWRQM